MYSYTLQIKDKDNDDTKYSNDEILHEIRKRNSFFIGASMQEIDDFTSMFTSFEDMNECFEEIYLQKLRLYDPMIIVDPSLDLDKSYIIPDIVYKYDRENIRDIFTLRKKLIYYLEKNPENIIKFPGLLKIKKIYASNNDNSVDKLVERIAFAYLNEKSYKKSRDTYFKIRKLERDGF